MQKTIYSPTYRKLVDELKSIRLRQKLRQEDVARRIGRSRHWIQKMETFQIRLDVYQFVILCRVYNLQPSRVIRRLEEEEASDEDPLFLRIAWSAVRDHGDQIGIVMGF